VVKNTYLETKLETNSFDSQNLVINVSDQFIIETILITNLDINYSFLKLC